MPDEVWQRLNPNAGRLSRRTTAKMWIAFVLMLLLVGAGTLVWQTGLIAPRLVWPGNGSRWEMSDDGVARVDVEIHNAGRFPAIVIDAGRSGTGLDLLGVEGPLPVTLQPGDTALVVLVYRITDCDATPRSRWPVTAVVQRPWGTMTVDVPREHDYVMEWQEHVVSSWCDAAAHQ